MLAKQLILEIAAARREFGESFDDFGYSYTGCTSSIEISQT